MEVITKMDFEEMGREGIGWIFLVENSDKLRAVVNAVMSFKVPPD